MSYIPPHRRPGFVKPTVNPSQAVVKTGVRFKSTQTGLPTHNITLHRFPEGPPSLDLRRMKKNSLKSRKKRRPALKTRTPKKRILREVKSAGPEKKHRVTLKAKSR